MKKLRYLFFCFAFSFYATMGLVSTLQHNTTPPIHVLEETPSLDINIEN